MTTSEMLHYCKGALMHYEMEFNEHAMSEDAESSIKRQLKELWNYMFPTSDAYAQNAKETLKKAKEQYGFD